MRYAVYKENVLIHVTGEFYTNETGRDLYESVYETLVEDKVISQTDKVTIKPLRECPA